MFFRIWEMEVFCWNCRASFYKEKNPLQRKLIICTRPKFSNKEILHQIKKYKLKALKIKKSLKFIANEISEGKVIGYFKEEWNLDLELGNRSIIVQAKDVSVNDWLNKNLKGQNLCHLLRSH